MKASWKGVSTSHVGGFLILVHVGSARRGQLVRILYLTTAIIRHDERKVGCMFHLIIMYIDEFRSTTGSILVLH